MSKPYRTITNELGTPSLTVWWGDGEVIVHDIFIGRTFSLPRKELVELVQFAERRMPGFIEEIKSAKKEPG